MFNKINENALKYSSGGWEKNSINFNFTLNSKEPEQKEGEKTYNIKSFGNSDDNINSKISKLYHDKYLNSESDSLNNINQNFNNFEEKNLIFKANIRTTHTGNDKDNIKQIIVRHFVNFFIQFINYIVNIKINKDIQFQISYKCKEQIKLEDITKFTVEKLLSFASLKVLNEESLKEKTIQNYRNIINSSLNELYHKNVIDIFRDIYAKDIKNETDKDINLRKYGIDGIFKLNENILKYDSLKEKYKNNIIKIYLIDKIVYSMVNPPKKKLFVTKRKDE